MATKIDSLNRELRNRIRIGKPSLWSHGDGLCFALAKNGNASWTFRYSINGKRRVMTLEPFREPITDKKLKELEMVAIEYRDQVKSGIDPLDRRKARSNVSTNSGETFRGVAEAYIETQRNGWRRLPTGTYSVATEPCDGSPTRTFGLCLSNWPRSTGSLRRTDPGKHQNRYGL